MKKLKILILLKMLTLASLSYAQLYIESDPIAFGLNGHSVHIGLQGKGFRFQLGNFGAEYPDAVKNNKEFNIYQSGYGGKIDYYGKDPSGVFIGLEYADTTAKFQIGSEEKKETIKLLGVRIGYKFMINKSFYIMPWIGVDKNVSKSEKVQISGETYDIPDIMIFPTVHIGFEF